MNKDIINLLGSIGDDSSNNELSLVSLSLRNHTDILNKNNIVYEETAEGIKIDLSSQKSFLYKNKKDCIKYCTQFDKEILIIDSRLFYKPGNKEIDVFFENLIFFEKVKQVLLKNDIASHNDKLKKEFILLSETKGRFNIGYKDKNNNFFNENHNLKILYDQIEEKFIYSEYVSFFKNNIIDSLDNVNNVDSRFIVLLEYLKNIVEKSNREFELFKSKFSFEQFNSDLRKEKDSYVKNIQNNLSDFLSKINSFPVQFGVYIYLIVRFKDNIIPLLAIILLIIFWGLFSFKTINAIKAMIVSNEKKIKDNIETIKKQTKMSNEDLELDDINKNITRIKNIIKWHKIFIVVSNIIFIVIGLFLVMIKFNEFNLLDTFKNCLTETLNTINKL